MKIKNKVLKVIGIVFGRKIFYRIGKILQHISHRMMGIGNYENDQISGESLVSDYISDLSSKDEKFIFVDIGAGDSSEQTQRLQKHFPKLVAYLYEPMPLTFSKLKKRYAKYKSIKTFNLAISNTNGKINIYDYKGEQTEHASMHKEALLASGKQISSSKIQVKSLKKIMAENDICQAPLLLHTVSK